MDSAGGAEPAENDRFLHLFEDLLPESGAAICEEPRPAYDRVQLTSFFSGKSAKDLNVVPDRFFQQHGVTLRLNDSVLAVDPVNKVVRSARYRAVPYDKLVFATGSSPFVPPVAGRDRKRDTAGGAREYSNRNPGY